MTATASETWWVHAAAAEAAGAPSLPGRVLALGVGKTEATLSLTAALAHARPARVIAFGIAGVYPAHGLDVGDVCVVGSDTLADEGVRTPAGFESLADLGLAEVGPFLSDAALSRQIAAALGVAVVAGATVSTCSGVDGLSARYAARTGAAVETMEGAAIGRVCRQYAIPWAQLRAISNRTGDRDRGGWDLARALRSLHQALATLAPVLS